MGERARRGLGVREVEDRGLGGGEKIQSKHVLNELYLVLSAAAVSLVFSFAL